MSGIFDLMRSAKQNAHNSEYSVYLKGDLCQMSVQKQFLMSHGISVEQNDVYPCVRPSDKEKVFTLLWSYKPEGWHHYCKEYVEFGLCTEEEFKTALHKSVHG